MNLAQAIWSEYAADLRARIVAAAPTLRLVEVITAIDWLTTVADLPPAVGISSAADYAYTEQELEEGIETEQGSAHIVLRLPWTTHTISPQTSSVTLTGWVLYDPGAQYPLLWGEIDPLTIEASSSNTSFQLRPEVELGSCTPPA